MSKKTAETPESKKIVPIVAEQRDKLYRHIKIERKDISGDKDDVVQLAAASEFPNVMRAKKVHVILGVAKQEGEEIVEILSHEDGDYDLTRFNNGNNAAFQDEHIDKRHLGHIRRGAVGKDKVTRVAAQFDLATKLSEIRQKQMVSGSRPNVSIGYYYTGYLGTRALDDGRTGHVFQWEGLEVSSVGVPADPTVGLNRTSAKHHCIDCGEVFDRADLSTEFQCKDCEAADTPAEDTDEARNKERITRLLKDKFWLACGIMTRGKTEAEKHSHREIESAVYSAASSHKDFKRKDSQGNVHSDFHVHDIHSVQDDGDTSYLAYILGPSDGPPNYNRQMHEVPFEYDAANKKAELGEVTPVQANTSWEPVERQFTERLTRSKVDSKKSAEVSVPTILIKKPKIMADEPKITPELVIDNLDNEHVRAAIAKKGYITSVEVEARAKAKSEKVQARNKEILALETELCRDFGTRIAHRSIGEGKKEPLYLRDGIHIAAMEACAADTDKSDSEVRQIFRSKVDDLKRDSVSEELIKRSMDLAEEGLAGRCGDMFETMKRCLADAEKTGFRSTALMPTGAEAEYTTERKNFFKNMPGAARMADLGGYFTPASKGRKMDPRMARSRDRMTRDALAGDFATAGAMIAPEFRPYIELLRNKIALAGVGATYIGGNTGELVFPRQEAATIAQSVAEGSQLLPYDQQLGQIKMGPHRVGSRQFYSRLALIQAPPDFETMVWNDHSKVLALYQDEMGLNGSGAADQPVGILNQPGISQLIFGGTPTYQSILNFRTNIRKFNVDGPLAFLTTSVGQGRLAYLPAALSGSTVITQGEKDALWQGDEIDGEMIGCKAMATQQIPGDILLAGVFAEMIIASWGGIFTIVDNYTRADRDEVAITFNTYFDIAVRHAQAFCRSLDSVNQ